MTSIIRNNNNNNNNGNKIPIIDIEPLIYNNNNNNNNKNYVIKQIRNACLQNGFFYVSNHGVDLNLIQELENLALKFFDQSVDIKSKIHMKQSGLHWKGFFALGEELTSGKPDNKEGIYFGEEYSLESEQVINKMAMHGPNQFPEPYNIWKTTVLKYMEELTTLGHIIMNAIALSLGLPSDFFEKQFCKPKPFTPFRIFRYPQGSNNFGVGRHTDYGVLTILKQDDVGGLQVEDPITKEWIDAPPVKDTFVVNIGDMLQLWTNGLYKATPHRVKASLNKDRISMPFFFDPAFETKILSDDITNAMMKGDGVTNINTTKSTKVKLTNAKGDVEKELTTDKVEAIRYGDYITHKVAAVFPELFEDSSGVDMLNNL
jgi:isopenicillin N synthase-like dioxygenase